MTGPITGLAHGATIVCVASAAPLPDSNVRTPCALFRYDEQLQRELHGSKALRHGIKHSKVSQLKPRLVGGEFLQGDHRAKCVQHAFLIEENPHIPSPKLLRKSRLEFSEVGPIWHLKGAQFLSCDRKGAVAYNNHCEVQCSLTCAKSYHAGKRETLSWTLNFRPTVPSALPDSG